ncbi:MAG TPA: MoaD/ThiS family protein, partial [Candidatus Nitrosopelagicus sp.]|nr:MoaD/ThiS family protein [Candidatus Nitrosopelagicus sp.]
MITVNFTGGARKSFDTNEIMLNKNNFTVKQLIDYLITVKPKNTANFDGKNLLIAINDIDSSALDGYDTILKNNDVVNIIPIIHGGSLLRTQLQILSKNIE